MVGADSLSQKKGVDSAGASTLLPVVIGSRVVRAVVQ